MAPTKFSIVLDNPLACYFPGQVITGKVVLSLDQEKNTQGLKLKFSGEAEVAWKESQGQSGSKVTRAKESYFHSKIVLVGDVITMITLAIDVERNSDITIPEGSHEYPFTFELPADLPSSFESEFGNVRYCIEAVVKRSWKFDYCTKTMFTVNALVDLNQEPSYSEPREATKEKSICCLCCKQGPILMKVEVPRTGYVSGEFIKFTVSSSNTSSRPVSAIVAYLIREISYRAQGRTRRISEEMAKVKGPEVQPFLSETWQENIQIPPVPPSDLGGCKIIGVTYMLKLKLDIPSSIDLKKKIPVVIGTIPLTASVASLPPLPTSEAENSLPLPPSVLSQYPNMPPPVYQEAMIFGKNENSNEDGKKDDPSSTPQQPQSRAESPTPGDLEYKFTPKYATYNYGCKFELNVPDHNGTN